MNDAGLSATLFALLDAAVLADRGPAGFEAKVAVGILGDQGVRWWLGDLDKAQGPTTSRPATRPDGWQAMLVIGADEARRLLEGRPFPRYPKVCRTFGDKKVLERFRQRYLERRNVLDLRIAKMKGAQ